jgi:hypothetical protein
MSIYDFPKPSNKLLTPAEKCVIDAMPDEAQQKFLESEGDQTGRITTMDINGVTTIRLDTPERVQAVKDYIEMMQETWKHAKESRDGD